MVNFYLRKNAGISLWDPPLDAGLEDYNKGIGVFSNGLSELDLYDTRSGDFTHGELNDELEAKPDSLIDEEQRVYSKVKKM